MTPNVLPWLWPVLFYLIGSIPTGYLLGRSRGIDIRQHGSGNIGATNVGRVMGRNWGFFAFGCDFLKGFLPLYLLRSFAFPENGAWTVSLLLVLCGMAVILGHNYTPWLGFKGGKGIATSAGMLGALLPWVLVVALSLWIIAVLTCRIVSIASLLASASLPLATAWFYPQQWVYFGLATLAATLATWRHRSNIQRLLAGTEPRLGSSSSKKKQRMNIIILGHGAWGRAIGQVTERLGHRVTFVSHSDKQWPPTKPDYILLALPVQHVRETLEHFSPPGVPVLSLSKGLEIASGQRVSQIITEVWGESRVAALSGPTFASEIAAGLPATCTIAAQSDDLAKEFQAILHQPSFRTYRTSDLIGVELGGALKNIYAIAGGNLPRAQAWTKFARRLDHPLLVRNDTHWCPCGRKSRDVRRIKRAG